MCVLIAIMVIGRRFRSEWPDKRWLQQFIRLDCLSAPNQRFAVSSRVKPLWRCKAPLTKTEISDSLPESNLIFFRSQVLQICLTRTKSLKSENKQSVSLLRSQAFLLQKRVDFYFNLYPYCPTIILPSPSVPATSRQSPVCPKSDRFCRNLPVIKSSPVQLRHQYSASARWQPCLS